MTNEMQCPVCGLNSIARDKENCPQCDADLTCYQVLDKIPDNLSGEAEKKSRVKFDTLLLSLLVLLLVLVSGLTAVILLQDDGQSRDSSELVTKLDFLRKSMDQIETKVNKLQKTADKGLVSAQNKTQAYTGKVLKSKKLSTENKTSSIYKQSRQNLDQNQSSGLETSKVSETSKPSETVQKSKSAKETKIKAGQESKPDLAGREFFTYNCKDTDTLWELAKEFYNNGKLYPVILKYNPDVPIYGIKDGIRLKMLKDKDQALSIFKQITVRENGRTYWKYTVQSQESLNSIAARYCNTKQCKEQIQDLNAALEVVPGKTLKIPMQ